MAEPVVLDHVSELGLDLFLPYDGLKKHGCKDSLSLVVFSGTYVCFVMPRYEAFLLRFFLRQNDKHHY